MSDHSLREVRPGEPVRADHINMLVKAVRDRTPQPSNTAKLILGPGGFTFDIPSRTPLPQSVPSHPFLVGPMSEEGDLTIAQGTVNDVVGNTYELTGLPTEGDCYIYIVVTGIINIENDYVINGTIDQWTFQGSATPLTDGSIYSYRLVALFEDGVKQFQNIVTSQWLVWYDNGLGISTPVALWGAA